MFISIIIVLEKTECLGNTIKTIQESVIIAIDTDEKDPQKINEAIKQVFNQELDKHPDSKVASISHTVLPV